MIQEVLFFTVYLFSNLFIVLVFGHSLYGCFSSKTTTIKTETKQGETKTTQQTGTKVNIFDLAENVDADGNVDVEALAKKNPELVERAKKEAEKEAQEQESKSKAAGQAPAEGDKKKSKEKSKEKSQKSKKSAEKSKKGSKEGEKKSGKDKSKKGSKEGGGGKTDRTQRNSNTERSTQASFTIDKTQRSLSKSKSRKDAVAPAADKKKSAEIGTNPIKNPEIVKLVDAVKASSKLKNSVKYCIQNGRFTMKLENYEDTYAVELSNKSGDVIFVLHNDTKKVTIAWGDKPTDFKKFDTPAKEYTYLTFLIKNNDTDVMLTGTLITKMTTKLAMTDVTTITTYGLERPPILFCSL
uniref:Major sperm protein n=1 Tax=Panagrellus redivivus TaxID=6233 RepID=A0A7E4ZX21_PANRE